MVLFNAAQFPQISDPRDAFGEGHTLADEAYRAIKADIVRGVRGPGERLRIEKLRTIYNIGPTPLREALQRLSADRLVVALGNRGFAVAAFDPDEFNDLNTARIAVEMAALRLSLQNGGIDWESGVVAAAYVIEREDKALAEDDGPRAGQLGARECGVSRLAGRGLRVEMAALDAVASARPVRTLSPGGSVARGGGAGAQRRTQRTRHGGAGTQRGCGLRVDRTALQPHRAGLSTDGAAMRRTGGMAP